MEISRYLAMTKGEIAHFSCPDGYYPGWMACHFSPYGTGLSNFPRQLPLGSMLILNDRTPICGHDPVLIRQQLEAAVIAYGCNCVLLDFQRPMVPETADLCAILSTGLPCPVGISEIYAKEIPGPVFLSSIPADHPPRDHFTPWQGREIWLETAPEAVEITVTESGSKTQSLPLPPECASFFDSTLYCRYCQEIREQEICFTLWRDLSALDALTQAVVAQGVTKTVGLFQDFALRSHSNAKKHPVQ